MSRSRKHIGRRRKNWERKKQRDRRANTNPTIRRNLRKKHQKAAKRPSANPTPRTIDTESPMEVHQATGAVHSSPPDRWSMVSGLSAHADIMPSSNCNEALVTGVGSGGSSKGDGDHSACVRNVPAHAQKPMSNPVIQQFTIGNGEPLSQSPDGEGLLDDAQNNLQTGVTTCPSSSKLQFHISPVEEKSGTGRVDEFPSVIQNEEDELAEESAPDELFPPDVADEETMQSIVQNMTNDPNANWASVVTDLLRPEDEVMNEQLPVTPVGNNLAASMDTLPTPSHHPEPTELPPVMQVEEESTSIDLQKHFHGAPTSTGNSCFIQLDKCRTTPPALPQRTWVGIAPYTSSIPHSHMGHIPRPKPYTSIVPPPAPSNVDVTQSTPQPKGCFSSSVFTAGEKMVFEFKVSPNLPSKKQDFAVAALRHVARFYSDVFDCSLERDLDLKIATNVHARMCSYTNEASCLKLNIPHDCKLLSKWLEVNPDLKCRLLVLQQVLNTLTIIHSQKLSLWGSFWVWVATGLEVYLLVDLSTVLQKQHAGITEDTRKMDLMAVKGIYKEIITSHSSFLCSQGLTRALHLFEQLINDPESYCWLAEGARLLGQQRVCRINVDIHFGQNTVLYCLEGEKLNTALMEISKMVPPHADYVWTVHSVPSQDKVLINATAIAEPQMHLVLKPSASHFSDPTLLLIRYTD